MVYANFLFIYLCSLHSFFCYILLFRSSRLSAVRLPFRTGDGWTTHDLRCYRSIPSCQSEKKGYSSVLHSHSSHHFPLALLGQAQNKMICGIPLLSFNASFLHYIKLWLDNHSLIVKKLTCRSVFSSLYQL